MYMVDSMKNPPYTKKGREPLPPLFYLATKTVENSPSGLFAVVLVGNG